MAVKLRYLTTTKTLTHEELEVINHNLWLIEQALNSVGAATPLVPGSGTPADHHLLSNLAAFDDHPQYLYLSGRAGGQTAYGGTGTGVGGTLTLRASSGSLFFPNTKVYLLDSGPALTIEDPDIYGIGGGVHELLHLTYNSSGGAGTLFSIWKSTSRAMLYFNASDFSCTLGLSTLNTVGAIELSSNTGITLRSGSTSLLTNTTNITQTGVGSLIFTIAGFSGTTITTGAASAPSIAVNAGNGFTGLISGGLSTDVKLIVRGVSSQSADLQQWQNTIGTVLAKIDKDGNLTIPSMSLTSALTVPNGGTGRTTLTDRGVLIGRGTAAIDQTAAGATNTVLRGQGGTANPDFGTITKDYIDNRTRRIHYEADDIIGLAIGTVGSGVNQMPRVIYPTGGIARGFITIKVPADYVSGGKINLHMAHGGSDTTTLSMNLYTKKVAAGTDVTAAYDNLDAFNNTTPGGTNILFFADVTISTSFAAGDLLRLCIERDGVTDGNLNNALVCGLDFEYTADM